MTYPETIAAIELANDLPTFSDEALAGSKLSFSSVYRSYKWYVVGTLEVDGQCYKAELFPL